MLCFRIVQVLTASASVKEITQTGVVPTNNDDNSTAIFETLTAPTISQTIIDFPPAVFSATFSLVPEPNDDPTVPTMLFPANVQVMSGDQIEVQQNIAPVSVFLPEDVVREATCSFPNGTVDPTETQCQRRIHFIVFTALSFFSEVRGESVENPDGSGTTTIRTPQSDVISPNSVVVSIQIEREFAEDADVLPGGQRRLASPIRISLRPINGSVSFF